MKDSFEEYLLSFIDTYSELIEKRTEELYPQSVLNRDINTLELLEQILIKYKECK